MNEEGPAPFLGHISKQLKGKFTYQVDRGFLLSVCC